MSPDFWINHGYDILKIAFEVVTILYGVVRFLEKKLLSIMGEHFFSKTDGERLETKLDVLTENMGYGDRQKRETSRPQIH